jgi:very-short-patch-repair endonuclease
LVVRKVAEPPAPRLPEALADEVDPASVHDFLDGPRLRSPRPPETLAPDPGGPDDEGRRAAWREWTRWQQLRRALDDWIAGEWRPWVAKAQPARAARRLYSDLFGLHLLLQANQATHELAWGHSVLSWQVAGQAVLAPMLTTRMSIEVDEDDGSLRLVPERPCELELDALEGLGLPLIEELSGLRERLRGTVPDPWLDGSLDQVNRQLIAPLGLDARISDTDRVPAPALQPVLTPTWVLFARRRPVRHERFYRELAEVIDETGFLPEGVAAVVADDATIDRSLAALGVDPGESWQAVADRPLLPLASNEDQERIIRQLARARGVTVQGPPGTGKTHTIANLVSHLVAHGKRVLVTAQNEQALAVLQGKIPPELRDLSVAVLGSGPEAMDQLRASAQAMTDLVSGLDVERETGRVAELGDQVEQLRIAIRQTELALVEALRSEESEFDLPSGPAKAAEIAAWLAARQTQLGHIPDRIPRGTGLPLTDPEIADLHRLCTDLAPDDVTAVRLHRPPMGDLPVGATFRDHYERLGRLRQTVADLEQDGIDLAAVDALDDTALTALTVLATSSAERLTRLEQAWLRDIRDAVRQSPDLQTYWAEQADQLSRRAATLVDLQRRIVGWVVEVPAGDHRSQQDLLDDLAARVADGKGVPRFGAKELRQFYDTVTVNQLPLRTPQEIDVVRAHIGLTVQTQGLQIHLSQLAAQAAIPVPPPDAAFITGVTVLVQQLQDALRWEAEDCSQVRVALRQAVPGLPDVPDAAALHRIGRLLDGVGVRRQERQLTGYLDQWAAYLDAGREMAGASPLWGLLRSGYSALRWDTWDGVLAEGARLDVLAPEVARRDALLDRLRPIAPHWTTRLESGSAAEELPAGLWRDAWRWAQAEAWLQELHAHGDLEALQRRHDAQRTQLAEIVIDLAKRSAALGLKRNLKDEQRRALLAWISAVKRVGKSTGKHAPHWAAQARQELPIAMGAVPIWIMPIHRVIENFDPRRSEPFDVVIVDESSQCDLLSVGVLALGRKCVVVGDDKQTTPAGIGVKHEEVFQLQDIYLADVPQKALLTIDESLYGIAERAFPNVVMLREHFRCVTDIILFSNRYYDHRILPLRERTRHGIGPVLRAVPVLEGVCTGTTSTRVNRPEAEALVDQVVACAADPAYEGASFGVVALQSGSQSKVIETLLAERLGFEEFQRRKLRVGNASAFQGDERDVVFISVVADDNGYAATRLGDKQRINVAASRPRDQLWVFHTVDPQTLHAEDQRRALIEYVRDAATHRDETTNLLERCESGFERDVLTHLLQRQYKVTVQHQVGSYRIDLVVHGDRDRLAIECDGDRFHGPEQWDDDLRRQRVLERLGWKFWRVLASTYYRSPHAALEALWIRLDRLGIHPTANRDPDLTMNPAPVLPAPRHVEHATPAKP